MIVLDASVVVELITNGPLASLIKDDLSSKDDSLLAPHLVDVEAASALRRMTAGQRIDPHLSEQLLVAIGRLPVERYPHTPLLGRIWELRRNFAAYDAAYIALAEATASVLYTCDEKVCHGHRAKVMLFRGFSGPDLY